MLRVLQGRRACQLVRSKEWVEFDLIVLSGTLWRMFKSVVFVLVLLSMVACQDVKDSPEMKQLEEEKALLKSLEGELKELRAEIAKVKVKKLEVPVEDLEKQLEETKAAVTALEEELKVLTKSEKEAKEKLEAYQKKYPFE
jgi:septal ring factor EnvC (AmiA/AmiB activator)